MPGNKMSAANLAVIFGPNVLHPPPPPPPGRAEEEALLPRARGGRGGERAVGLGHSAAVIALMQALIHNHRALFTVSPEAQRAVLTSLWRTHPDVAGPLLQRRLHGARGWEVDASAGGVGREPRQADVRPPCPADPVAPLPLPPRGAREEESVRAGPRPRRSPRPSPSASSLFCWGAAHRIAAPLATLRTGPSPHRDPPRARRMSRSHEDLSRLASRPPQE
ncbi:rho GTPase-activating protein 36 [Tachyglossus aculeatus]|uniref:rho GTPase-activating protein 36 n=1 Tax=Tachyglossus aculeatus TaxID=9261 RepID=UPI0018F3F001|nr:rho GTPase-activating protein 36 [Tachyglossus aculeatus]